jgi:N-ethylmaleimide reductase
MDPLFEALSVGSVTVPNRIVLAPMTRARASEAHVAQPLMAEYYAQRAGAGLIVSEATGISRQGLGWVKAPGIWTDEQTNAWKQVTSAVHQAGGRIALQLWHMGRASHPDFLNGELPVAPSAIRANGETYTPQGKKAYVTPRALDAAELPGIVADYARAARNAHAAGFDMVEIHSANGYLLDEFLRDGANQRRDAYGGSPQNRVRLVREVMEAVVGEFGASRTGIRFSPRSPYNDMSDSDPLATYTEAFRAVQEAGLAYIHLVDPVNEGTQIHPALRPIFRGALIVNGGYTGDSARATLQAGTADLIAFGVPFIANPDLSVRLREGLPLATPDFSTVYGGGEGGYTDYPSLALA